MSRLVFLLEEYSMKVLLDGLIPRLFPELPFLCISHEGKQELESWYIGDPDAMAEAFDDPRLSSIGTRAVYRDPDAVRKPSSEIKKLVPRFQKVSGARSMASKLSIRRNISKSFQVVMKSLAQFNNEEPISKVCYF